MARRSIRLWGPVLACVLAASAVAGCEEAGEPSGGRSSAASASGTPTWKPPKDDDGGSGGGSGGVEGLSYLPPGPGAPNTEGAPDHESVYDHLTDPRTCASARKEIPDAPEDSKLTEHSEPEAWAVLRGLAEACLAVQGKGGSWSEAAKAYAAVPGGRPATCKGRAAYAVLGRLLRYHREHPGATARLRGPSSGSGTACRWRIVRLDAGGDAVARPGETVEVELLGTYFDFGDAYKTISVMLGRVPVVLQDMGMSGDRLTLSFVVPDGTPAGRLKVMVRSVRAAEPMTLTVEAGPGSGGGPKDPSPDPEPTDPGGPTDPTDPTDPGEPTDPGAGESGSESGPEPESAAR